VTKVPITIEFDPETVSELLEIAEREESSFSKVVEIMIRDGIKKRDLMPPWMDTSILSSYQPFS